MRVRIAAVATIAVVMVVWMGLSHRARTQTHAKRRMTIQLLLDDIPADAYGPALQPAVTAFDAGDYPGALKVTSQVLAQPSVDPKTGALAAILAGFATSMPPRQQFPAKRRQTTELFRRAVELSAPAEGCPWLHPTAQMLALTAKLSSPGCGLTPEELNAVLAVLVKDPESAVGSRALRVIEAGLQGLSRRDVAKVAETLNALYVRPWKTPRGRDNSESAVSVLVQCYRANKMYAPEIAVLQRAQRDFPDSGEAAAAPRLIAAAEAAMKQAAEAKAGVH